MGLVSDPSLTRLVRDFNFKNRKSQLSSKNDVALNRSMNKTC